MRNILFPILFVFFIQVHAPVSGQITATIIGSASEVCQGDSLAAYLNITGGVAPWNMVINDKDGQYLILDSISSPYTIWLTPDADNTYYIASVVDSLGTIGSPLGEVEVTVNPSTPVDIIIDRVTYLDSDPGISLVSSPAGAVFTGAGVTGSMFYPSIAGYQDSPHTVLSTYTNSYGCVTTDQVDIEVLSGISSVWLESGGVTVNALCDDGATYYIKGSNEDNIPGTFELVAAGSVNPIPGHISDPVPTDDEAVFDPVGLSGAYDIIYTYSLNEVSVSSTFRFFVNDLGDIEISDLPDTVCKNDAPYLLIPELVEHDPGATFTFTGPGITGNQAQGYYFDPAGEDVPVGENEITVDYTSSNGCKSQSDIVIYNSFVPTVSFVLSPICLPVDGGTVSFTNMTSGKFSVASWSWDFDDPESGDANYSSEENPTHFYSDPSYRKIWLTAYTHDGCVATFAEDTVLVDQPDVDFTLLNDCFIRGDRTYLMDRTISTFAEIDTLVWTFKTSSGGVLGVIGSGSPSDTIEFPFTSMDQYVVELHVENKAGCAGDGSREIMLKPIIQLDQEGYTENFNGGADDWLVFSEDQEMSWVLGEPEFTGFDQIPGNLSWYTDLPVHTAGYLERSWVQSPCYDLSQLSDPLIQMDLMKSFIPGTDGAVLQYQDYVSEGWKTIGTVGSGLNWYNEWGIYNEPGGGNFGWGLALFNPDTRWVTAGHALEMMAGKPHVKFRVAIATTGAQQIGNQGFAFDNFFVGDRMRTSLLEHFTNASSETAEAADDVVDNLVDQHTGEVIDLQYHLDYPGEDPMNENNIYPPSDRAFHYGVPGVPYAVLNGSAGLDERFDFSDASEEPDAASLENASLEIPPFKLFLAVDYMEDSLEATVSVLCTADTFTSNLQLYVAVIEREVTAYTGGNQDTSFRNVVLDMLPNAAGKLLGSGWYQGKIETRTFTWTYAPYVEDIEDLSVVAFIQDRDAKKILHADAKPHTPGVGISNKYLKNRPLNIYPNPADHYLFINLGSRVNTEGELKMVDPAGRIVWSGDVQPGYTIQRVDIGHLTDGMYLLYWLESGAIKGRTKLMIAH